MSKVSYTLYEGSGMNFPVFQDGENNVARQIRVINFDNKKYDGLRMELMFYENFIKRRIKLSENLRKYNAPRVYELDPIDITSPHINVPALKIMAFQEMQKVLDQIEKEPSVKSSKGNTDSVHKTHKTKNKQKNKVKHYSGDITFFGDKERITGKKKFNQYCLELFDPTLDEIVQVWGIDLKRALDVIKANKGDRVHVTFNGYIETPITQKQEDGTQVSKTVKKRSYTILKSTK